MLFNTLNNLKSMKKRAQKSFTLLIALLFCTFLVNAQDDKSKRPSPPAQASGKAGAANIKIEYSQPSVKGRKVWGELVPYGQVWRTGANEATTFEVDQDVKVQGQTLPAGKYALFTIPGEKEWTIVFNKTAQQWGAFKYDEAQDALRVKATPKKAPQAMEKLTFKVDQKGKVSLFWENMEVDFQVSSAGKAKS